MENALEVSGRISIMLDTLGINKNSFAKSLGYNKPQTIYVSSQFSRVKPSSC